MQQPQATGITLSFRFAPQLLPSLVLPTIFERGAQYGSNPTMGLKDPKDPSKGVKRIIIEFSSPNIAKEFHAGHLRSTIIGGFLSNLYSGCGWEVVRMNYLGDWGRQYGLLAVGWKKFGSEELLQTQGTAHLFDIYVKISALFKPEEETYQLAVKEGKDTSALENSGLLGEAKNYFKRMEDGDEEALKVWRRFRNLSIDKYKVSYARLNVFFDEYSGESQVQGATMGRLESILREKGVSEVEGGAVKVFFKKHGAPKLEHTVIRNRNGSTNYLLRDMGAAVERYEKLDFDQMIYVVSVQQDMHFMRLFKIFELMGGQQAEMVKKMRHVNFGAVQGMSTRKGTVKFLDDILDGCGDAMHEVMKNNATKYAQVEDPVKVADTVGISSVMVQDFTGKRVNGYPFNMDRMTSFEGDTGPYLQYAHARLCSVGRKAGYSQEQLAKADYGLLKKKHAIDLLRAMASYTDVVTQTLKTLEPVTVLTYLFKLTHQLSSSYDVLRVVDAPEGPETSLARAALYEAARQVLSNGMKLLGLSPVDR